MLDKSLTIIILIKTSLILKSVLENKITIAPSSRIPPHSNSWLSSKLITSPLLLISRVNPEQLTFKHEALYQKGPSKTIISSKIIFFSSFCPLTTIILELINSTVISSAAVRLTPLRTRSPLRMLQAKCFVRTMYGREAVGSKRSR